MTNSPEIQGSAKPSALAQEARLLDGRARPLTGWCGMGMVGTIVMNGPLSQAVQRIPSYWDAGAGANFAAYLHDGANVDQMVVFFALIESDLRVCDRILRGTSPHQQPV
jgi:hypothetical protein